MFNSLSIRYRFIIPVALIVILSITVSALWTTRQVRVGAHPGGGGENQKRPQDRGDLAG